MILALLAAQSPFQLTAAQVQQCGARAVERNRGVEELKTRDAALAAEQQALAARQAALIAQGGTVNRTKKKEVERYNAASAAFNADNDALRPRIAARNGLNQSISALVDAYNLNCAHKSMNPADVAALPPEQRDAISVGAKTSTIYVPAKAPRRR